MKNPVSSAPATYTEKAFLNMGDVSGKIHVPEQAKRKTGSRKILSLICFFCVIAFLRLQESNLFFSVFLRVGKVLLLVPLAYSIQIIYLEKPLVPYYLKPCFNTNLPVAGPVTGKQPDKWKFKTCSFEYSIAYPPITINSHNGWISKLDSGFGLRKNNMLVTKGPENHSCLKKSDASKKVVLTKIIAPVPCRKLRNYGSVTGRLPNPSSAEEIN